MSTEPTTPRSERYQTRSAPSDADCLAAWDEVMRIASEHALIVQAYGGVATLAIPEEQRKAGVRERALKAQLMVESV